MSTAQNNFPLKTGGGEKESAEEAKEDWRNLKELNEPMEEQEDLPIKGGKMKDAQMQMEQSKENMKRRLEAEQAEPAEGHATNERYEEDGEAQQDGNGDEHGEHGSLRQIHGLIKLVIRSREKHAEFNEVQQTDPRYLGITQNQLKLKMMLKCWKTVC